MDTSFKRKRQLGLIAHHTLVGPEHPYCQALIEAHKACLRVEGFKVLASNGAEILYSFRTVLACFRPLKSSKATFGGRRLCCVAAAPGYCFQACSRAWRLLCSFVFLLLCFALAHCARYAP
jgi:hypothetical protein